MKDVSIKHCTYFERLCTWKSRKSKYSKTLFHDFHVQNIEILRKRSDAVKVCNKDIDDNDKKYRESLMSLVGCIPSNWKRFVDEKVDNLSECHTQSQFNQH